MERYTFLVDNIIFTCEFEKDILTLLYIETNMTTPLREGENINLTKLKKYLEGYLIGNRDGYEGKIAISGTPKKKRVYEELMKVSFGETISYQELAERAGIDRGARFAGNAMADNNLILIVPCHRVIKSDRTIGAYGPGVEYKKRFLKIEGSIKNVKNYSA